MIVLAYHGTEATAAVSILSHNFQPSRNDYDWLGDGAYFFQDAPARAWEWARRRFGADAAVIGAEIDLTDCLDLLDIRWHDLHRQCYLRWTASRERKGLAPPRQTKGAHRLDREVINFAVSWIEEVDQVRLRSVRAAFAEGEPLFPESALLSHSHVQICVRDPSSILRRWRL
ncbi:MAG TPA: hypothetical protein VFQ45_06395 [Longimicrobium sp.]|nr:hypothetical protein [Longimicrobium sp.]